MALFKSGVLGVAIVWVVWVLFEMRQRLCTGGLVVPPMFASTVLFALGIIFVLVWASRPCICSGGSRSLLCSALGY